MRHIRWASLSILGLIGMVTQAVSQETPARLEVAKDATPTPYHRDANFVPDLPNAKPWGSVVGVGVNQGHIWVVQRCGRNVCDGSSDDPIIEFDMSGKPVKSFGSGLFVAPHGLTFDKNGDFYVADYQGKPAKGRVIYKFNQNGKILMTLGTPGVAGDGPDKFTEPNEVAIAPNGDLFVADGHSVKPGSTARIVKLSPHGKFIKEWGTFGEGPGEFKMPHALRFDSEGRLWVADRYNKRLQVFDQDGKYITEYRQFGAPVAIDFEGDAIFVADADSTPTFNPGFPRGRGINVGNWKTGKITDFIPLDGDSTKPGNSGAEDLKVDQGAIYAGMVIQKLFVKYVK